MKPSIQTLGQVLYSPSQYVIPVYQRNYRWERPQWNKLWESLIDLQSSGKTGNHFMGFLVVVSELAQPGQNTRFHLVDGQQRLSTCSILLAAIRNVARETDKSLADEINDDYLIHPRKKGEQRYRLLPKERDHDAYVAIVDDSGEQTGRMAEALEYFEQLVAAEGAPQLRVLFDTLRQRFEFMSATLEEENAYNIFKSLNSTGVPLGAADLIRNYVFMHVAFDEHDDFDAKRWSPLENRFTREDGTLDEVSFSRFFRDYLMSEGKYVEKNETFAAFESRYDATEFSPRDLASQLGQSAHNYDIIRGRAKDASDGVNRALSALNVLDSSTTYPLLLALFRRRQAGDLDNGQLIRSIEMLRGFILRRFVAGESSRGYAQMFIRAVAASEGEDSAGKLEGYLLERGWPDDERFVRTFVEFPFYTRAYAKEVLIAIERSRGHKEPADLLGAQIEHVIPQTITEAWRAMLGAEADRVHSEWLHRIANLTLTGYNPELSNSPFEEKLERYLSSNVVITREIASYPQWSENELRARGEKLAREAASIWTGPKEPHVASRDSRSGLRGLRLDFWTAAADYLLQEVPEVPKFSPRNNWAVYLPSGVRNVAVYLLLSLKHGQVSVSIKFERNSVEVLSHLQDNPEEWSEVMGGEWQFSRSDTENRAWLSAVKPSTPRDESSWARDFEWFGNTLHSLYENGIPLIRDIFESRTGAEPADGGARQLQIHFWNAFREYITGSGSLLRCQSPGPRHWMNHTIGYSGIHQSSVISTTSSTTGRFEPEIRAELVLTGDEAKKNFAALHARKDEIEQCLGFTLTWYNPEDSTMCRLYAREDADFKDEALWPQQFEWLRRKQEALLGCFLPIVNELRETPAG